MRDRQRHIGGGEWGRDKETETLKDKETETERGGGGGEQKKKQQHKSAPVQRGKQHATPDRSEPLVSYNDGRFAFSQRRSSL